MIIIKQKGKYFILFFLLIVFIFPLTGCWDAEETDRMVYAQGLGIDYKDGKYTVYVQLMNLSLLAKAESSGGNGMDIQSEIGQATGSSLENAFYTLYETAQRQIHWGHLNYIFFTENALKSQALQEITEIMDRYYESHYRMYIYSTKNPIEDLMSTDPPMNMSTYLTRISDPKEAFEQNSRFQPIDMREMIVLHYQPPHEVVIPHAAVNKKDWKGDKETRSIGIINGVSIISNNTLKGTILNGDAQGIRWMNLKKFERTGLSLTPKEGETEGITITKKKIDIKPVIEDGKIQFDVKMDAEAVIYKLASNMKLSQLSKAAKKIIENDIRRTYRKSLEMDSDIYRLSEVLYKKDYQAWKKVEKGGKIPLHEDSIRKIDIEIMIHNGGKNRKLPTLK
ncbi:Ger(x)C family spore germination protein [Bacillus tuaregi]|uniref:Ger(x)C family spore germination protein n=1 Tax=Bacillus tuaregi TaxID=1816695 RepID=UPI00135656CF|nr:Ger(x)C family spore germination protein [Bacillus tuaregi]